MVGYPSHVYLENPFYFVDRDGYHIPNFTFALLSITFNLFFIFNFLRYVGYFTTEVTPNLDKPLLQFNGASDKLGLVS